LCSPDLGEEKKSEAIHDFPRNQKEREKSSVGILNDQRKPAYGARGGGEKKEGFQPIIGRRKKRFNLHLFVIGKEKRKRLPIPIIPRMGRKNIFCSSFKGKEGKGEGNFFFFSLRGKGAQTMPEGRERVLFRSPGRRSC